MTIEETKQLRIEFERRLQIMYPNSKFLEKLNSDTIYSILNEYQIKYVKQLYFTQRQQNVGLIGAEHIDNILQALCTTTTITVLTNLLTHASTFDLPDDYWLYARSVSNGVREGKQSVLSNEIIEEKDVNAVIQKYNNYAGIIRHPLVFVQNGIGHIIYDLYTDVNTVDLTYYRMPKPFGKHEKTNKVAGDLEFDNIIYKEVVASDIPTIDAHDVVIDIDQGDNYEIVPDEGGNIAGSNIDISALKIVYSEPQNQFYLHDTVNNIYYSLFGQDATNYSLVEDKHYYCKQDGRRYVCRNGRLVGDINACELPISAFDDLISGALKLYLFEYKFALATAASNSKYNKLKNGVDKLAQDDKQEQQ